MIFQDSVSEEVCNVESNSSLDYEIETSWDVSHHYDDLNQSTSTLSSLNNDEIGDQVEDDVSEENMDSEEEFVYLKSRVISKDAKSANSVDSTNSDEKYMHSDDEYVSDNAYDHESAMNDWHVELCRYKLPASTPISNDSYSLPHLSKVARRLDSIWEVQYHSSNQDHFNEENKSMELDECREDKSPIQEPITLRAEPKHLSIEDTVRNNHRERQSNALILYTNAMDDSKSLIYYKHTIQSESTSLTSPQLRNHTHTDGTSEQVKVDEMTDEADRMHDFGEINSIIENWRVQLSEVSELVVSPRKENTSSYYINQNYNQVYPNDHENKDNTSVFCNILSMDKLLDKSLMEVKIPGLPFKIILYFLCIKFSNDTDDNESQEHVIVRLRNISHHIVEFTTKIDAPHLIMVDDEPRVIGGSSNFVKFHPLESSLLIELLPKEESGIYISRFHEKYKNQKDQLCVLDYTLQAVRKGIMNQYSFLQVLFQTLKMKMISSQLSTSSRFSNTILNGVTPFIDTILPPDGNSISRLEPKSNVKWVRVKEIYPDSRITLFSEDGPPIHVDHILQGKLGDCYLLSAAISILYYHPNLILNLFTISNYNDQGIYEVRVCFNGEWIKVHIDDHFPLTDSNDRARFVHSDSPVIWPAILEKAYAKLYGDYITIKRGKSENAFTDLTGMPCKRIEFRKISKKIRMGGLFSQIEGYLLNKYPMCTCTNSNIDKEKTGLGKGHAYSLLSVRSYFDEESNTTYQLLRLRDPRGKTSCKLPFNPNDPVWSRNSHLYHHFHHDQRSHHEFWISYNDYIECFNRISMCMVRKWYEKRSRIYCVEGAHNIFQLTILEPSTTVYLMIHQMDKQVLQSQDYLYTCAVVLDPTGKYCFDTGFHRKRTIRHPKYTFKQTGTYTIIPILASSQKSRSMLLSIHADDRIKLTQMEETPKSINFNTIMAQALLKIGAQQRMKKINGSKVQSWLWKGNRDFMVGLKLCKLGKTKSSVSIDYKITYKNMVVVFGKDSGNVILTAENNFVFLARLCPNSSKALSHTFHWKEKGALSNKTKKTILKK